MTLVVIEILIALQTQSKSRKPKKNTNTRLEYYEQLLEDLKKNKEFAKQAIEIFSADRAKYNSYLELYQAQQEHLPKSIINYSSWYSIHLNK